MKRKPPPRPPYLPLRLIHYANGGQQPQPTSLHRRRGLGKPASQPAEHSQQLQQSKAAQSPLQLQDGAATSRQLQDLPHAASASTSAKAARKAEASGPAWTLMMCRMADPHQQPGAEEDLGGKISDELLVCKICYSRFSQRKLPKLLVCSHTFCEPCVTRYHKTASRTTILNERSPNGGQNGNGGSPTEEVFPCPLCRKTTALPEGGVEKLPNNLTVMSLMELMDQQPGCCTPLRAPSVCSLGGEPTYLTSATGTRLIGKSCSQDRIALALGVLCSVQTCAVCDRKYPESEFPCGHCVCSVCSSFANEDQSGTLQCPKCAGDLQSARSSPETSPPEEEAVTSQPTSIQTEPVVNQPESVQTPMSSDLSITTGSSSPHPPIVSSSSPNSDALTSKADSECSATDHLQVIADAIQKLGQLQGHKTESKEPSSPMSTGSNRDPPYNPSYVENPLYGTSSNVKRKPTPPPPPMLQHERMQQRNKAYSLPRLSPKHISNPIPETFTREQRLARAYDSVQSIQTAVSVASEASLKTTSDYGTIRQPPVPPKRRLSTPRIFRRFSLRRRSKSCPAKSSCRPDPPQPSAPDSTIDLTEESHYQIPSSLYRVPPPVPPPRRIYDSPTVTPVKCIKKFGKYSETRMQTSTFRQPTKVAVSEQGDIVVVDIQHMTVQVFTLAGDYLSMFKVVGVQGASFFSPDRLAVATHRGITIYSLWGQKMHDLLTPYRVTNTAPFKFGFAACTPKCVYIYRQSLTLAKELNGQQKQQTKRKLSLFGEARLKKQSQFEKLQDVAVTMCKKLAILDSGKGVVHIIDEEGVPRMTIEPAQQACGQLREPHSVAVDRSNNVYVADTGNQRVLRFANNGAFSRCVLNCRTSTSEKKLAPYGLATTATGHLVVVMAGNHTAEVRIYLVS